MALPPQSGILICCKQGAHRAPLVAAALMIHGLAETSVGRKSESSCHLKGGRPHARNMLSRIQLGGGRGAATRACARTAHYTQGCPAKWAMGHIKQLRWIADFNARTPRVRITGSEFLQDVVNFQKLVLGSLRRLWEDDPPQIVDASAKGFGAVLPGVRPMLRAIWVDQQEHGRL